MIVTLEELLAHVVTAEGRDRRSAAHRQERTGVRSVPMTGQERSDAARRRVARRAAGKHRKARQ